MRRTGQSTHARSATDTAHLARRIGDPAPGAAGPPSRAVVCAAHRLRACMSLSARLADLPRQQSDSVAACLWLAGLHSGASVLLVLGAAGGGLCLTVRSTTPWRAASWRSCRPRWSASCSPTENGPTTPRAPRSISPDRSRRRPWSSGACCATSWCRLRAVRSPTGTPGPATFLASRCWSAARSMSGSRRWNLRACSGSGPGMAGWDGCTRSHPGSPAPAASAAGEGGETSPAAERGPGDERVG